MVKTRMTGGAMKDFILRWGEVIGAYLTLGICVLTFSRKSLLREALLCLAYAGLLTVFVLLSE